MICTHKALWMFTHTVWTLNIICIYRALWMFTHIVLWILSAPTALLMVGLWIWFVFTKLCGCLLTLCSEYYLLPQLCWWLGSEYDLYSQSFVDVYSHCALNIICSHSFVDGWALNMICTHKALWMFTHTVWALNIIYTYRALLMVTHTVWALIIICTYRALWMFTHTVWALNIIYTYRALVMITHFLWVLNIYLYPEGLVDGYSHCLSSEYYVYSEGFVNAVGWIFSVAIGLCYYLLTLM
jgi:hypothetical protein